MKPIKYPISQAVKVSCEQRIFIEQIASEFELSLAEATRWILDEGIKELRSEKIV